MYLSKPVLVNGKCEILKAIARGATQAFTIQITLNPMRCLT